MRFVLLSLLLFTYVHADLQSRIISKAQTACFLKNSGNGLSASDYTPSISNQTFRQDVIQTFNDDDGTLCQNWELDPYVNVDTETYQVIADMECSVTSREVTEGNITTTYYDRVIKQYVLDINCQEACTYPRDASGTLYDFTTDFDTTSCNVQTLQETLDNYNPNSGYIIDDARYITCSANTSATGCYYHKHVNFEDNHIDNNSTDFNMTETNNKLDDINSTLKVSNQHLNTINSSIIENGQRLDDLGTKLDTNKESIDNLGIKIDSNGLGINATTTAVIDSGNYTGDKIDNLGNFLSNELKFQGNRLHNDLQSLQSQPNENNGSSGFDDSGIIEAIHQNTDAINEIKDLNEGEIDADASFLDTYQTYYDDMSQSIESVENNVNDLMATIQGDYTPQFQSHNSCIIYFTIYNKSQSINMCRYSPMLRPYFTFVLTIAMLILLILLHFYLFPKVFKSD